MGLFPFINEIIIKNSKFELLYFQNVFMYKIDVLIIDKRDFILISLIL